MVDQPLGLLVVHKLLLWTQSGAPQRYVNVGLDSPHELVRYIMLYLP